MQLGLQVLAILNRKLLDTDLSVRNIAASISLLDDLFDQMSLVSRLPAFDSLELFIVVEPSEHIFFSLGAHVVYLRFLKVLFRLVYFVEFLLEPLQLVVSRILNSHDSILLMLHLLLFFLFLKLKFLLMLFLLLPHLDILLMVLQNNFVHSVIFRFLLQLGLVLDDFINLVRLMLLLFESASVI